MKFHFLKSKKAEFYIISAVILIGILASLSARMNYGVSTPKAVRFYDLSQNFEGESYRIIDTYIFQGSQKDIESALEQFTDYYLQYAHEKDPNLGLVYIYGNETGVYVKNSINGIVTVIGSKSVTDITNKNYLSLSKISVNISGKETSRSVAEQAKEFGAINKAALGSTPWVIVNLAGALYSFNTNDAQNFYVIATTKSDEAVPEIWLDNSMSVPQTAEKCTTDCIQELNASQACLEGDCGNAACGEACGDAHPDLRINKNQIINCVISATALSGLRSQQCAGKICANYNLRGADSSKPRCDRKDGCYCLDKEMARQNNYYKACRDGFDNDGDTGIDNVEDPSCGCTASCKGNS